jgi:hypothetical protein
MERAQCIVAQGGPMSDLLFLLILGIFFLATFGLVEVCRNVMEE